MAKLEDFIAFQAALALHETAGSLTTTLDTIYALCKTSVQNKDSEATNHVKALYAPFTQEQLSQKIAELLTHKEIKCPVKIIYQTIEGLHSACSNHKGDWYFHRELPYSRR